MSVACAMDNGAGPTRRASAGSAGAAGRSEWSGRPTMRFRRAVTALAILGAFTTHSPGSPAADAAATGLLACAALRKDAERLACYDRLAARVASGADADADAIVPSAEEMFGLSGGSVVSPAQRTTSPVERVELEEIAAHVVSVKPLRQGGWLIELDNGQTWQQLESRSLVLEAGAPVKISRGALGSFRLTTSSGRSARVRRVR